MITFPPDYIHFAYFGRPHGLKGAFFLKTEDRRTVWDKYKLLLVETQNGFVERKVLKHYLSGNALVLELEGVNSRTEVEALYGKKICIHKNEIKLNENEFLVHDLMNYDVLVKEKGLLGHIVGIISYGAQENLEIKMNSTQNTILYPFVDKYILHINSEKKQIEVEYLEEFFEN
ncbi:MAG: ribosome maturation factor RimM [Bdellovibrionota bacterium]